MDTFKGHFLKFQNKLNIYRYCKISYLSLTDYYNLSLFIINRQLYFGTFVNIFNIFLLYYVCIFIYT